LSEYFSTAFNSPALFMLKPVAQLK